MMALQGPAGVRVVESPDSPVLAHHYLRASGMRLVRPYHFDFVCNVKQRWHGMNILDVFSQEFPARSRGYYERALADGRLRVEGGRGAQNRGDPTAPLHQGQTMRHFIHRHEPPVLDLPIPVLGESGDVVAVGKPPTMPVHVSGQYRKNTVLGVLQAERPDLGPLLPVHRLDKAVSGVLLFARSRRAADALRRRIEGRAVEKVYLARVLGAFPEHPVAVDAALSWNPATNHVTVVPGGPMVTSAAADLSGAAAPPPAAACAGKDAADARAGVVEPNQYPGGAAAASHSAPLGVGDAGAGMDTSEPCAADRAASSAARCREQPGDSSSGTPSTASADRQQAGSQGWQEPKAALTRFRRLALAGDCKTSIVECRPVTGRTHQIRVHLQHLGHPIANDAQYALGAVVYPGPERPTAFLVNVEEGQQEQPAGAASSRGLEASWHPQEKASRDQGEGGGMVLELEVALEESRWRGGEGEGDAAVVRSDALTVEPDSRDPLCPHCPSLPPRGCSLNLRPLWLHACRYSCEDWSYECPLPAWAQESWVPPSPAELTAAESMTETVKPR